MNIYEWSQGIWHSIPEETRKRCIDHLYEWIKDSGNEQKNIYYLKRYRENPDFHFFGGGMAIRNMLRDVLTDDQLPVVTVDHTGEPYGPSQNWDDCYTGAIDELLERYK